MSNKLFIVCPFSCMEPLLQQKYGSDITFLTCSGAVIPQQEVEYLSEVKRFIIRENINQIYIVNDISCRFLNGVISRKKMFGLNAEKAFEELYVDYYFTDFKDQKLLEQQYNLALRNISKQAKSIVQSPILGDILKEFDVQIKGVVTVKDQRIFREIEIPEIREISYNSYEL